MSNWPLDFAKHVGVGFDVLTAVMMKNQDFWEVAFCRLVNSF